MVSVKNINKSLVNHIFDITSVGKKLLLFNLYFVNNIVGKGSNKEKFINTRKLKTKSVIIVENTRSGVLLIFNKVFFRT